MLFHNEIIIFVVMYAQFSNNLFHFRAFLGTKFSTFNNNFFLLINNIGDNKQIMSLKIIREEIFYLLQKLFATRIRRRS